MWRLAYGPKPKQLKFEAPFQRSRRRGRPTSESEIYLRGHNLRRLMERLGQTGDTTTFKPTQISADKRVSLISRNDR
jgi:hypothetical protein